MKNYEINEETLAIMPKEYGNKNIIYEENDSFETTEDALKIIKHSCEEYGCTYSGRIKGSKKLLGCSGKTPLVIKGGTDIIFFPINSPRNKDCTWISFNNIKDYYRDNKTTVIHFNNGKTMQTNISYGVFNNQYLKAMKLFFVLAKKNQKK